MKRLGYGIVGAGFVGPNHIEAVRRLGFVEIAALASAISTSPGEKLTNYLCRALTAAMRN